jgi:hypothetical protein
MLKKILAVALAFLLITPGSSFAAWTTPRTWVASELVTATMMNAHIRDNENALRDYLLGAQDLGANWLISTGRELRMSDATNVAHGMTTIAPTDVYSQMKVNGVLGGLVVRTFTDGDTNPLYFVLSNGAASPTNSGMVIDAYKKSGTSVTAMATTERILDIRNGGTNVMRVAGDAKITFHASGVAHGLTTVDPTDTYGALFAVSSTAGGLNVRGMSDTDATALNLVGVIGTTTPTAATVSISGFKSDGATGAASLNTTEHIVDIQNAGTTKAFFNGAGNMCVFDANYCIEGAAGTGAFRADTSASVTYTRNGTNGIWTLSTQSATASVSVGQPVAGTPSLYPAGSGTHDLGQTSNQFKRLYLKEQWQGDEISDPSAPAANKGVVYFRDNGSGKTQFVARFPTGAVQVIATEP